MLISIPLVALAILVLIEARFGPDSTDECLERERASDGELTPAGAEDGRHGSDRAA